MTTTTEEDARGASRRLAEVLLRIADGIAERAVARMQELMPSYAAVPRGELLPVTLANTRSLLEVMRDPERDTSAAREIFRASGEVRARQGITGDEILHGWGIGLEALRETAYVVGEELQMPPEALLEFVEGTLRWGDIGMLASASAHREAQVRELGRLYEEQTALRRVATLVARGSSSERLFAVVAEQVATVFRVPLVRITRYEADDTATEYASRSDRGELFPVGTRWSLEGANVLAQVRATGRPARINDHAGLTGIIAETIHRTGIRSTVAAPIVVTGEIWGAIAVSSRGPEPLPPETESRLRDFSELIAMSISNANAREEVERLAQEQAALRRIATQVAERRAPAEVFSAVSKEVSRLFATDLVAVGRLDPAGPAHVVVGLAESVEGVAVGSRWELDDSMAVARVYRTGRSARVDDVDWSRVTASIRAPAGRLQVVSAVSSPIIVEGRMWGAISVSAAERLPPDAAERLEKFTDIVATAVANAESREALRQLADEQAALRRVATLVAREAPPEEVFLAVAEEVGPLLDAEAGSVDRFEPGGYRRVVGSWGKLREAFEIGTRWKLEGDGVSATVYRTHRPVRLESYDHASGTTAAEARRVGLHTAAGTPIVVGGRVWGALVVATARARPLPMDADSRLAQFAELVATAIANVQARSDLAASRDRVVAAADEERHRVGRDLREGAQQRLAHAIVTAKLARNELERDRREAVGLVAEALEHAQTANEELRELSHGILPSTLTNGGLGAGLRGLASRMSIPVEIDAPVERLPLTVEATAYFVVAEALTNVAGASHAHHATVSARVEDRTLHVEVRNDGTRPNTSDSPRLAELRDRLAALDGRLRVGAAADGGSVITASIPVG